MKYVAILGIILLLLTACSGGVLSSPAAEEGMREGISSSDVPTLSVSRNIRGESINANTTALQLTTSWNPPGGPAFNADSPVALQLHIEDFENARVLLTEDSEIELRFSHNTPHAITMTRWDTKYLTGDQGVFDALEEQGIYGEPIVLSENTFHVSLQELPSVYEVRVEYNYGVVYHAFVIDRMPEDQGHQPIQPRANDYATPSEFLTLATPEYSALAFYHYEDDTLQMHFLFGEDHINRLFDTLRAVPYEWVEDWSNERVGDTLYAFEIRGQDGWPLSMIWSNGYWINAHGDVFSFDYDFSTIFDSFPFDTSNGFTTSFASVPGIRTIALTEKGWDTRFLQPAGLLNGSNDITMELLEITGPSATVALTNHGTEEWFYGVDYTIQVQIDGIWYEVPPTEQVAFVAIAMLLGPGETNEETLDLSFYRELPTGFYRIVKANLTVEFDVC